MGGDSVWRFGGCEFNEATGVLRVDGRTVELDASCRAILSLLLANAGHRVGKEQLLEAGWPGRIVHENSLAKAVGRLRQILGEQGEALKAVYRYGYKLDIMARPPADSAVVTPAPHRRRLLLAGAALAAVAGIGGAILVREGQRAEETPFRTTPPVIADVPDAIGRVLWVDDNPQNNIFEERFFKHHRIAVHTVRSSTDALRLLSMYDYDVVISDMGRGEDRLAGVRLVERMRAAGDQTAFVIYTVRAEGEQNQRAQQELVTEAGAQGLAVTPEEIRALILRFFDNPEPRT